MRVYLDWNATTPPLAEVLAAMQDAPWGNPASVHADGRAARAAVEDARAAVGQLVGRDPRDILFTSGGTEANNLALRSAKGVVVTSRLEHPSVTRVAETLPNVRWLRVLPSGVIDLEDLDAALAAGDVSLVTVQAVNHETGVRQPVRDVIERAHAAGAQVHVDAVQAWGRIDTSEVAAADSASLAAHKLRGPKGIGALVMRPGLAVSPVLLGGAQEKGLRPGTVAPALAAGLGVAARHALEGSVRYARIAELRDALENGLLALGGQRVGDPALRAPHVSTLVWPGWASAELMAALDLEGVSVSSGAACSAGTVEPSPVLEAMIGPALAASGVRCSLGELTKREDIDAAVSAFTRVIARGR